MDKLILAITNRGDRTPKLYPFGPAGLTIGRAYSNDVIVDDPFVSPHQFRISNNDGEVTLEVIEGVNPILLKKRILEDSPFVLPIGESLSIGKTQLMVLAQNTEVAPTKKQFMSSWPFLSKVGPAIAVVTLLAYSLLDSLAKYLQTSTDLKWQEPAYMTLITAATVVVWAVIWGIAGRIYKHQSQFFVQLFVTSIVGAIFIIVFPIVDLIDFQANQVLIGSIAIYITALLFLFLLLKANLAIATNSTRTSLIAFLCSLFLVGITFASEQYSSYQLNYDQQSFPRTVKPPFAVLSKPLSIDEYLVKIAEVELDLNQEE